MTRTSFFARTTWGQPNYLLVAMATAFLLALIPRGAKQALDSTGSDVKQWLPGSYGAVQDLKWFGEHFPGEQFALLSWDGCTLGNTAQVEWLAKRLMSGARATAKSDAHSSPAGYERWFLRAVTGPEVVKQLTQPPVGLPYREAIKRVEGALVGPPQRDAQGRSLGDDSRTTCLVVSLSQEATRDLRSTRAALDAIVDVAASECHIDPATIHMGGPPVDNVAIDAEGRRTLLQLAVMAAAVSLGLCHWRLKSIHLTAMVVAFGAICAAMSLAIVFYFGVGEVLALRRASPHWGKLDALLMAMPAVVYLLAVSAALHAMNYYFEVRREHGSRGAAERLFVAAWHPCLLCAATTAVALLALTASDIFPIRKFGLFTALSLIASVGILLLALPMALHRFPVKDSAVDARFARRDSSRLARPLRGLVHLLARRSAPALACWTILLIVVGAGMFKLRSSVQILKLLDRDADLIQDYAWLEQRLGNLVPMEVVLTMPPERLRTGDEHAEHDGQQYRLTMLERVELLRQIEQRLESFPQISRAMSAAAFTPAATQTRLTGANRGGDYAKNKALEAHMPLLLEGDYLRLERQPGSQTPTGRELWRLSARVAALSDDASGVDYAAFVEQLRRSVEPVLLAYQQRDCIVRALHERGKQLDGAKVCVLFRAPGHAAAPPAAAQELALAELLTRSGVAPRGVSYFNLAVFEHPDKGNGDKDEAYRQAAIATLQKQDAVILASAPTDATPQKMQTAGVPIVDVADLPATTESTREVAADHGGPRPIRAVFTGTAPLVEQTQRQLLASLRRGVIWTTGMVAVVLVLTMTSVGAGLLAMAPVTFPLAVTFGAMGWLGIKMDLGLLMTAGVALGAAVDGTIHFTTWFRRASALGHNRRDAVLYAYDHCAPALIEIALITGLGLSVFGFSNFTPTRQFGCLMSAMLGASLVGNLLMLPAMLASPLGWFFSPLSVRRKTSLWPVLKVRRTSKRMAMETTPEAPSAAPPPPHVLPHHGVDAPGAGRRTALSVHDLRREAADGPHASLHAKLQKLRRSRAGDSPSS